jgi:MurNAc alpha-1-phosphate uridylyltransferase
MQPPPSDAPAAVTHAMLLAAGLGTRMRPLTDAMPKPVVPVAGRPIVDYLLDHVLAAGVTRVVANVHYLADILEAHLSARLGDRLVISDERERLLDSGGGVRKALPWLGEGPFFVLNADSFWIEGPRSNLARLAAAFDPAAMDALLLLAPAATAIGWGNRGDFAMDQEGRIRRPRPGEMTPFAYAGVGVFTARVIAPHPEVFSLNRVFDAAIAEGRLHGIRLDGVFLHVGTPQAVAEAERAIGDSLR